ncbi:MAG: hypothetical protein IJ852_03125 [Alphaproteobacteria bacterium]|nr:hypothetical protein [Alphaproteobacteria bacterium]
MKLADFVIKAVNETNSHQIEKYRNFLKRLFSKYIRRIQRDTSLSEKEKQKLLKKYTDVSENLLSVLMYKNMLVCDKKILYDLFSSAENEEEDEEEKMFYPNRSETE